MARLQGCRIVRIVRKRMEDCEESADEGAAVRLGFSEVGLWVFYGMGSVLVWECAGEKRGFWRKWLCFAVIFE